MGHPVHRFLGVAAHPGSSAYGYRPDPRFVSWLEDLLRRFKGTRVEVSIRSVTREVARLRVIRFASRR